MLKAWLAISKFVNQGMGQLNQKHFSQVYAKIVYLISKINITYQFLLLVDPVVIMNGTTSSSPPTKPTQSGDEQTTTVPRTQTTTMPYTCKQGWSDFMNVDKPTQSHTYETSGSGDYELIPELRKYYSFCARPTGIMCQTAKDGLQYTMGPDLEVECNLDTGLRCLNDKQGGFDCADYEVSVNCDCGSMYSTILSVCQKVCKLLNLPYGLDECKRSSF